MMKFVFTGLIWLFSFAFHVPAMSDWQQPELGYVMTPVKKPFPAPAFELKDWDDEPLSLSDLDGSVVLLNFWATWCPPCRREMPSMEHLQDKVGNEGFRVVAINQMEDPDTVFAFTGELDAEPTFTILYDRDSAVSGSYRVNGLPTTYLIDKRGMVRYRSIGGRVFDHPEIVALIRKLMNE